MNKLTVPMLAALFAIGAKPAAATPMTYNFSGTVTSLNVLSGNPANTNINMWLPGLYDGMPMTGTFVFDGTTGQADLQVMLGTYIFAGNSFSESVVNNSTFAVNDSTVPFGDLVSFWDAFPTMLTPPPSAFLADDLLLDLWDSTGTSLSGDTVQSGDLASFSHRLITFDGLGFSSTGSATIDWQATINTPEPSSLLLIMSSGLMGLGVTRRRWAARRAIRRA